MYSLDQSGLRTYSTCHVHAHSSININIEVYFGFYSPVNPWEWKWGALTDIQSWVVTDYMQSGLHNQIPKMKYLHKIKLHFIFN